MTSLQDKVSAYIAELLQDCKVEDERHGRLHSDGQIVDIFVYKPNPQHVSIDVHYW